MSGIFSGPEKMLAGKKKSTIHTTMYELEIGCEDYDFPLAFIERTTSCISRAI